MLKKMKNSKSAVTGAVIILLSFVLNGVGLSASVMISLGFAASLSMFRL